METSSISRVFRIYREAFRRRPVFFTVSAIVGAVIYGYFLTKVGLFKTRVFAEPVMTVRFEPTEVYKLGPEKLALKRVHVLSSSREAIEKITTTIEAPKFASEIKVVSTPRVNESISAFESSNGRKRFEVLCRSVDAKEELVITVVGSATPGTTLTDTLSHDTAVVVEVVGTTKGGHLFGASAVGEFSLRDSERSPPSGGQSPK